MRKMISKYLWNQAYEMAEEKKSSIATEYRTKRVYRETPKGLRAFDVSRPIAYYPEKTVVGIYKRLKREWKDTPWNERKRGTLR